MNKRVPPPLFGLYPAFVLCAVWAVWAGSWLDGAFAALIGLGAVAVIYYYRKRPDA